MIKNYTNLIYANQLKTRISRSIISVIRNKKTRWNAKSTRNNALDVPSPPNDAFQKKRTTHFYLQGHETEPKITSSK